MQDLVQLESVGKTYHMADIDVSVLQGISLSIREGENISIMGPSGSGKSTLMHIIGCLDVPTVGEYSLSGQSVAGLSESKLAPLRAKYIGFVFQSFNLLPSLSALENVKLPLMYQGVGAREQRIRAIEMLERVGLKERMNHRPAQLSGGQQQRVAIARAIVTNPPLILADEPTGSLDSHSGREILDLFHQLHEDGRTIVVITHDVGVAKESDRIIEIKDGMIKEERQVPV